MSIEDRNKAQVFPVMNINIGKNGVTIVAGLRNSEKTDHINETREFAISPRNKGLVGLKEQLENSIKERNRIDNELKDAENSLSELTNSLRKKQSGFFSKFFSGKNKFSDLENLIEETNQHINDLRNQYEECKTEINVTFDSELESQYKKLADSFRRLTTSKMIWDISTEVPNIEIKSSAKSIVTRNQVSFEVAEIDFIKTDYSAFLLRNVNGYNLYIYPGFILILKTQGSIELLNLNTLDFIFTQQNFLENSESIPPDSKIVGNTWYKVNKDGSRDLRFVGNYQIPIVNYGNFKFRAPNGLDETYYISNLDLAINFANDFGKYLSFFSDENKYSEDPTENYEKITSLLDLDSLTIQAAQLFIDHPDSITESYIQEKLKIDSERSETIVRQLEELKIVTAKNDKTNRVLIVKDLSSLFSTLENLKNNFEPSTAPIDTDKNKFFAKKYFDLLGDFSNKINQFAIKLGQDKILAEKIRDGLGKTSPEDFLTYCIVYDMCQVLKMLCHNNFNKYSPEMTGLALITSRLFPKIEVGPFNLAYKKVADSHIKGIYRDVAENMISIAGNSNPLTINILATTESKYDAKSDMKTTLALPAVLKIMHHIFYDEYATMLYQFASIISKADDTITKDEDDTLKKIFQQIHSPLPEDENKSLRVFEVDDKESLQNVLQELDSLIGLDSVKQEVKSLINFIKVQKERKNMGLKTSQISLHSVFTGSPGTGKTTIARIVAKIFMHLGFLKKGHLVETDRSGLIAEYAGQTAIKVNKTVDSALDGVLFIDEAYSLIGENQDDFGREAVATLIKRIEDDRDKFIVILAGYTKEMKIFIETNPGFKSRFNRYIEFVDYTPDELESIFLSLCNKLEFKLSDEATNKLSEYISSSCKNKDSSFGNGRFARNIFEKTLEKQANRIAGVSSISKEVLTTITANDIPDN